jgi:hypothetical protein
MKVPETLKILPDALHLTSTLCGDATAIFAEIFGQ